LALDESKISVLCLRMQLDCTLLHIDDVKLERVGTFFEDYKYL